jgi:hypothetical protein
MPEFPCPNPITVEVRIAGGSLELTAEPRDTAQVEITPYDDTDAARQAAEQARVELTGDRLVITTPESTGWAMRWRVPRVRITARVPTGSSGKLRVAAADTACRGQWAGLNLGNASGSADFDEVTGDLTVNSASGDLRVQRVGGRLTVKTASGDVWARQVAGSVDVKTASGNVQIEDAGADVNVKSASGDARVGAARQGSVRVATVSGDVAVGVVSGTGVWMDLNSLTGNTRSDLTMGGDAAEAGHSLTVQARAVSGNIDVYRVTMPTASA